MRLQRVSKAREHRVFKDFAWPKELLPFGRFNLVYGWNGTGKTTLSNLLRSIQTRTPIVEGDVAFDFGGQVVSGKNLPDSGSWLPEVRVFNRDYVSRSVFESPSTQNLPPVPGVNYPELSATTIVSGAVGG
jgi:energy-coupling factor transporter ATP-binding protein EcfA2